MKPGEVRQALRQRRQELRRDLAKMRQQARERARSLRGGRKRRRGLLALPLLLLLLLLRCPEDPAPTVAKLEPKVAAKPVEKLRTVQPRKPPRPPLAGHLGNRPRAAYENSAQVPPTWIDELRLQAAARSPRLAGCFAGSDRPGAIRWNAALNPETGAVSDHDLEPLGPRSTLTAEQRTCVVQALSSPRYHLTTPPTQPFPERVTLVIEF